MGDIVMFGDLLKEVTKRKFFSSGVTTLDLALGGGWIVGGVVNVVGDESTGKTLLACQSGAMIQKRGGLLFYSDAEGTLDIFRAVKVFGLDKKLSFYLSSRTVENLYWHLLKALSVLKSLEKKRCGLFVLDSLDSIGTTLTRRAIEDGLKRVSKDMETEMNEIDLSMRDKLDKSALMSWLFSVVIGDLIDNDMTFMIVSQTRAKIGATFGDKTTVSGGNALKFYSSQRVKLSEIGKIKKSDKVVGIRIRARVIKNKVAPPFSESEFPIYFESGIDDVEACVDYLRSNGILGSKSYDWRKKSFKSKDRLVEYLKEDDQRIIDLKNLVRSVWNKDKEKMEVVDGKEE